MRTKRASRYSHPSEHNQYGIYNWFRSKKITSKEVIFEVVWHYINKDKESVDCLSNKKAERKTFDYVANEFNKFAPFAMKYLRENNYI